jgi:hypothetical protein
MIASLYKINPVMSDNIYKPMFLGNPSRPNTWAKKFERLGFTDALKRISHYRFDELKNSQGGLAVRFHPVAQILPEFWLENGFPLCGRFGLFGKPIQDQPQFEAHQSFAVCLILSGPYPVLKEVALHWSVIEAGVPFRVCPSARRLISSQHPLPHGVEW